MSRRHEEIWWMILEQLTRIADSLAVLVVALSDSSDIKDDEAALSSDIKDDEDKDSPELA